MRKTFIQLALLGMAWGCSPSNFAKEVQAMALEPYKEVQPIEMRGESDTNNARLVKDKDQGLTESVGRDTKFLTSLVMPGGSVVKFWEKKSGEFLITETGRYPAAPSSPRAIAEAADTLGVFTRLAPVGMIVPEQLQKATERETLLEKYFSEQQANITQPFISEETLAPPGSESNKTLSASAATVASVNTSACPWSWFNAQFSLLTQGPAAVRNWFYQQRTGTTSYLGARRSIVVASACSYRGNIRFNLWDKPHNQIVWTDAPTYTRVLHAGEWAAILTRSEWWYQHPRDIYSQVVNADGDGYHHKGLGCERKAFSQCAINGPDGGWWGE